MDDDQIDQAQAPLLAKKRPILALISELEALTLLFFDKAPPDCDSPYMNEALMTAILRDLHISA